LLLIITDVLTQCRRVTDGQTDGLTEVMLFSRSPCSA